MFTESPFSQTGPARRPTVSLLTLGCKLNQAESEGLALELARRGYCVLSRESPADVFVVNSCTVTHVADQKTRQLLHRLRRANPEAKIVVTGCYAERAPELVAGVAEVDAVVPNADKEGLVAIVEGLAPAGSGLEELPSLANGRTPLRRVRSIVKVGDGCDKFCSYCIVPYTRGRERSEPLDSVIRAVQDRVREGCLEVVLTAVNLGRWGAEWHRDGKSALPGLLHALLEQTSVRRLRLSSIEPEDFHPDLIYLLRNERVCRHLHLPLQSGSETVLQRMRRRYDRAAYAKLVEVLRKEIPGLAVTTDVLVGFPGETEEEFEQTCEFVSAMEFAAVHIFRYSPRPGTAAAQMAGQIPATVKSQRASRLAAIAEVGKLRFQRSLIGERPDVLYEGPLNSATLSKGGRVWRGLTDNYVRVYCPSDESLANRLVATTLVGEHQNGLWGDVSPVAGCN